jgi:hypothetical protein
MLFSDLPVIEVCGIGVTLTVPRTSPPKLCKTEQLGNNRCSRWQIGPVPSGLNLLERRLVESHTTVIIPFNDRVVFVSLLNCAEFSSRLSEVTKSLDAISGFKFLVGGRWLGERWLLGTV